MIWRTSIHFPISKVDNAAVIATLIQHNLSFSRTISPHLLIQHANHMRGSKGLSYRYLQQQLRRVIAVEDGLYMVRGPSSSYKTLNRWTVLRYDDTLCPKSTYISNSDKNSRKSTQFSIASRRVPEAMLEEYRQERKKCCEDEVQKILVVKDSRDECL